jgi:hypothetical protein
MNALQSKIKEVSGSLIPIVVYVVLCVLVFVPMESRVVWRFLIGSLFLFIGLTFFLWGIDQSMAPIGHYMAIKMVHFKTKVAALIFSFIIGFMVTIAEPDLIILGQQIEAATGGILDGRFFVFIVSVGVGILIVLGSFQILSGKPLNIFFLAVYGIIALMSIFASNEYIAISFDASGATTGSLTTPFILAMSYGFSKIQRSHQGTNEGSFGLVGSMSAGPILATLLLAIGPGSVSLSGGSPEPLAEESVLSLFKSIGPVMAESLLAISPIVIFFFILNAISFHISKRELVGIIRGLIYSLIGLSFFLAGANGGFMEMGRLLGNGMSSKHPILMVALGFILGYIVAAAEPAVHVLSEQVEEVTAGYLSAKLLGRTLSIGVGSAIALSTIRILVPALQIWHFLLPGFLAAIILSFYVDDIFVGIAFDAGGVASGPMAATFVLAFSQGIAESWPQADILRDGFGIIAMIAMTPIVSILTLGALAKRSRLRDEKKEDVQEKKICTNPMVTVDIYDKNISCYDLVAVVVKGGEADKLIDRAKALGAGGATILHGRDERGRQWARYALNLDPAKDMVWFLLAAEKTDDFCIGMQGESFDGRPPEIFVIPATMSLGLT